MITNYIYNLNKEQKKRELLYSNKDQSFIEQYQIKKLNTQWHYLYSKIEFYKYYKDEYKLPNKISNFKNLQQFPIINKDYINSNFNKILTNYKNFKFTLTGGTSGITMSFPTNFYNSKNNFNNQYFLRNQFNIKYNDSCLYIWGHSHKFSNNLFKKNVQKIIKHSKNKVFNRTYVSSYELNENILKNIIDIIITKKPKYILTYSSTVSVLLNFLSVTNKVINNKIKFITTSENLPIDDYKKFNIFFPNGLLINEYGMAETGVIGYNNPKDNYYEIINLWHDYVLQSKNNELIITELSRKAFPLFRYSPDDLVNLSNSENLFKFIPEGKERPIFLILGKNNNSKVSSIKFDHILKNFKNIISSQYFYEHNILSILLYSINEINNNEILKKINEELKFQSLNIKIFRIKKPIKTISGKFKYLIKKEDYKNLLI